MVKDLKLLQRNKENAVIPLIAEWKKSPADGQYGEDSFEGVFKNDLLHNQLAKTGRRVIMGVRKGGAQDDGRNEDDGKHHPGRDGENGKQNQQKNGSAF